MFYTLKKAAENNSLKSDTIKNMVEIGAITVEEGATLDALRKAYAKQVRDLAKDATARDIVALVNREGLGGILRTEYSEEHGMTFADKALGEKGRVSVEFPKGQNDRLAILLRVVFNAMAEASKDEEEEVAPVSLTAVG